MGTTVRPHDYPDRRGQLCGWDRGIRNGIPRLSCQARLCSVGVGDARGMSRSTVLTQLTLPRPGCRRPQPWRVALGRRLATQRGSLCRFARLRVGLAGSQNVDPALFAPWLRRFRAPSDVSGAPCPVGTGALARWSATETARIAPKTTALVDPALARCSRGGLVGMDVLFTPKCRGLTSAEGWRPAAAASGDMR